VVRDEDYTRTRLAPDFSIMQQALAVAHTDWLEKHGASSAYETERTRCNIIRDRAVHELRQAAVDRPWIRPVENGDLVVFNWHQEYLIKIKKASDRMDVALTGHSFRYNFTITKSRTLSFHL
jgi:hypothetical protein